MDQPSVAEVAVKPLLPLGVHNFWVEGGSVAPGGGSLQNGSRNNGSSSKDNNLVLKAEGLGVTVTVWYQPIPLPT